MATFTIRIPDALHKCIKDAAHRDKRSMNSEIEWLLAVALEDAEDIAEADASLDAPGASVTLEQVKAELKAKGKR